MFEVYKFCRQVDDVADTDRAARRAGSPSSIAIATTSPRSMPGGRPSRMGGFIDPLKRVRPAARGFPRHHRRHGNGRRLRHPRRRILRRSISIAIASPAPSDACRCGYSACPMRTALRCRIISAVRCSSPISSRDVDEDADMGRLYLPREYLAAAGITSAPIRKEVLGQIPISAGLRAADRAAREHFRRGARDHGPADPRQREGAAHHGRSLCADARCAAGTRLSVRRASACASNRAASHLRGPAIRVSSDDAEARPHCRRRSRRPFRCCSADAGRHTPSPCTKPRARPAAAAAPTTMPQTGMHIDNGTHLLLSGNYSAVDYLKCNRRRRRISRPPISASSTAPMAKAGFCALAMAACRWWIFDAASRVPQTAHRRLSEAGCRC